jgi:hypothetical protein
MGHRINMFCDPCSRLKSYREQAQAASLLVVPGVPGVTQQKHRSRRWFSPQKGTKAPALLDSPLFSIAQNVPKEVVYD